MDVLNVRFRLPILEGIEVTGKDEPPAIEGSAYAFEHLGFLGSKKGKLTGVVEMLIDTETGAVVFATGDVPNIELEVTVPKGTFGRDCRETFPVLPHRIQMTRQTTPPGQRGGNPKK